MVIGIIAATSCWALTCDLAFVPPHHGQSIGFTRCRTEHVPSTLRPNRAEPGVILCHPLQALDYHHPPAVDVFVSSSPYHTHSRFLGATMILSILVLMVLLLRRLLRTTSSPESCCQASPPLRYARGPSIMLPQQVGLIFMDAPNTLY